TRLVSDWSSDVCSSDLAITSCGFITAPRLAIFSPDGKWEVENVGVPPDVEVEMTPKDVIAGHDPQLEKAVQLVMDELKKNPVKRSEERRVGKGGRGGRH